MQIIVDLKEYMNLKTATELADAIRLFKGVETANVRVLDSRPTPRALDRWESVAFSGSFLA